MGREYNHDIHRDRQWREFWRTSSTRAMRVMDGSNHNADHQASDAQRSEHPSRASMAIGNHRRESVECGLHHRGTE